MKISLLRKKPAIFRRLTGISIEKFDEIMFELQPKYEEWNNQRLNSKERQRKTGAGGKFTLTLEDRLLMLLIYYRFYVSHVFLGFLFELDDSNIGRNINPIQKLLAGIFKIPERRISMNEDEILELFFDGMEQAIQRPKWEQRRWYSGKKKKHTIKHQIVVSRIKKKGEKTKLRIKAVSKSFPGKTHDKKIYDYAKAKSPPEVSGLGDTGYIGSGLIIPFRRSKNKPLTKKQKQYNKNHSSKRVIVEHGIGKMKIWRILSDKYRNGRQHHTLITKNIAGLHNLMFA